jgi:tetratricopeptide (TPR) repeat protein
LEQKYRILIEQEKFSDALAVAKTLQSIADKPQYILYEVHVLNELKKYDDAIEIVQKLREKYPEDAFQWIRVLVEVYYKQKAYDKALALIEEQLQ